MFPYLFLFKSFYFVGVEFIEKSYEVKELLFLSKSSFYDDNLLGDLVVYLFRYGLDSL